MYFNFFKYHVQDRDYNRTEVASLINDNSYKHHLLAGGAHFYSLGTFAETTFLPSLFAIPTVGFIGIGARIGESSLLMAVPVGVFSLLTTVVVSIINFNEISKCDDNRDILHIYRNQYGVEYASNLVLKFQPEEVKDEHYSGKEVTKFLNEYHNYNMLKTNSNTHYDKIVNDFLNHKYIDAEIPTTSNSWFFEWNAAVLDIQPAVIETDYVNS
ncbi:hypothetical protein [Rickettsiales endosymbiont of Stachyamoeba lipophora]|uniref:hypothetical protein n=1 Tax=Rickettsiales endosymbiont of Stachyamoeba lipophora TaxID=2486578 RepID=UPI000F64F6DF|nr:hypothetical protein [Rickettsiales endosymbiont of Stachyamoeba lipophora]AZL16387.1 hypothetical protein EF513_07610 [Rickettsiales endosymbiont of Stachyamoeba lipophora]